MCVNSDEYPASLELRKVYQRVRDAKAETKGLVRVIDESGEDYLYPALSSEQLRGGQAAASGQASIHAGVVINQNPILGKLAEHFLLEVESSGKVKNSTHVDLAQTTVRMIRMQLGEPSDVHRARSCQRTDLEPRRLPCRKMLR
jgi:hypothetical protein